MADKVTEILLAALKQAMAESRELRLFRSGKLPGLFPGRTGASAAAATRALQEGLLEVVRTETRGKTAVDWVRPSPKGVHFVYETDNPRRALEDLESLLRINREAVPVRLAEIRQGLQALATRLTEEAQRWSERLEALSHRVEEGLRRAEAAKTRQGNSTAASIPWAVDALTYLDRRRDGGATDRCPLPELFQALRQSHADLSMTVFHDGLRRLRDRQALHLAPFDGPLHELPQPEYALPDGPDLLYFAAR